MNKVLFLLKKKKNIITITIIMLSIKGPILTSFTCIFLRRWPTDIMTIFFPHDRSFACFFMIFPGHRSKEIQEKFVNFGPLIIIIIIITHLNKSLLTSDFKFQLLISATLSVSCPAAIIPTDIWPP